MYLYKEREGGGVGEQLYFERSDWEKHKELLLSLANGSDALPQ